MKKVFARTVLAASLVCLATPSFAMGWFQKVSQTRSNHTNNGHTEPKPQTPPTNNNNTKSVPEIDAAGAALALALLGGVVAISRERRKSK